ncbi:hypothetical protein [Paenarthrobacter ureafaciens]
MSPTTIPGSSPAGSGSSSSAADWLNRSRARAADSLGSNAVPT